MSGFIYLMLFKGFGTNLASYVLPAGRFNLITRRVYLRAASSRSADRRRVASICQAQARSLFVLFTWRGIHEFSCSRRSKTEKRLNQYIQWVYIWVRDSVNWYTYSICMSQYLSMMLVFSSLRDFYLVYFVFSPFITLSVYLCKIIIPRLLL